MFLGTSAGRFLICARRSERFEVLVEGAPGWRADYFFRSSCFFEQLAQVATRGPGQATELPSAVAEGGRDVRGLDVGPLLEHLAEGFPPAAGGLGQGPRAASRLWGTGQRPLQV